MTTPKSVEEQALESAEKFYENSIIPACRQEKEYAYCMGYLAACAPRDAEIAALKAREDLWRAAFDLARDYVLNERGPLAEQNAGHEFINDVLGILDDSFAHLVQTIPLPAAKEREG